MKTSIWSDSTAAMLCAIEGVVLELRSLRSGRREVLGLFQVYLVSRNLLCKGLTHHIISSSRVVFLYL